MKHFVLLLILLFVEDIYSQQKHSILVNINQPESCVTTSIPNMDKGLTVYPNPTQKSLIIESERNINQLIIVDTTGRIIYSQRRTGNRIDLDMSQYKRGIYQCIIKYQNGISHSKVVLD